MRPFEQINETIMAKSFSENKSLQSIQPDVKKHALKLYLTMVVNVVWHFTTQLQI